MSGTRAIVSFSSQVSLLMGVSLVFNIKCSTSLVEAVESKLGELSMEGGAGLLDLPLELLELITSQPCLSLPDICRLSLTCRRLYDVITYSWTKIASSRLPTNSLNFKYNVPVQNEKYVEF